MERSFGRYLATLDLADDQARIAELAENVSQLQDRIDVLQATHANVVASLNEARSRHQSDIEYLSEQLMEEVCGWENCKQALARVKANKGSPGVDGMTVYDFPEHLKQHQ